MAFKLCKFLVDLFCFSGHSFWSDNFYPYKKIAMFPASFYSFPGYPECRIILNASRDFQINVAFVYRFDLNSCSRVRP